MTTTTTLYQCRLCLKRTPTRINIHGGDFPKMLEALASIKVRENDGLPRYSCSKCAQDVKTALLVRKRIMKAHTILLEDVKKKRELFEKQAAAIGAIINGGEDKSNTQKSNDDDNSETTSQDVQINEDSIRINEDNRQINEESVPISGGKEQSIPTTSSHKQAPIEFVNIEDAEPLSEVKVEPVEMTENRDLVTFYQVKVNQKAARKRDKNFACQPCNLTFIDRPAYNLHILKHKKTKCHICERLIRTDNIRKHIMLHSAGPSVCQLCGATCKNIESLRGHMFYQHKHAGKQFVCDECGESFRIKYKFLLHKKKTHMGLRNFECEICGKGFFTKGSLMVHGRTTHDKLRPHVCEFCGSGFASPYSLKTHKRQHTNEKPYVCEICSDGFRQRVSLRTHLKSKHGIEEAKEFFCKTCSKGFVTSYALSIHERLHSLKKCEVCSQTFTGVFLKNHLRKAHNIVREDVADEEETRTE